MESDLRSEICLPSSKSLEIVSNNIVMLNKLIYKNIINVIRIELGSTQGLNVKQCYLRLKSMIKKMPSHSRP